MQAIDREFGRLRAACQQMADDYQVSEKHHPDHALVPMAVFDLMRVALRTLAIAEHRSELRAVTHVYQPHPRYPWFCGECGYPEHERLKHPSRKEEASRGGS